MGAPAAELLRRRLVPSATIATSRVTLPARLAAAGRRRAGRRGRLEMFFAFDDPCSAVAVIDLVGKTQGRAVELLMLPVLRRGIRGDPAVELKRAYAVTDARRLARRLAMELSRTEPLPPDSTAFLAEWVAAHRQPSPGLSAFCARAMRNLWFQSDGPPSRSALESIWHDELGTAPPAGRQAAAVRWDEARMGRRGPYETPAVWVAGRWYFAQDRPGPIMEYLDLLGWGEAA